MRYIRATDEHDMVAAFLRAEINSERFAKDILALLQRDEVDRKVIDQPDLSNPQDNHYRLQLLGSLRGDKQNRDFFAGFPQDVVWYRAAIG